MATFGSIIRDGGLYCTTVNMDEILYIEVGNSSTGPYRKITFRNGATLAVDALGPFHRTNLLKEPE